MPGTLKPYADEARAIAREARAEFGSLTPEQVSWKPAPERWSVAQCLEHLIRIDSGYWPVFRRIAEGSYRAPLRVRLLFPKAMGRMILKAVQPTSPKAYRTSKSVDPAADDVAPRVVDRYEAHLAELVRHIEAMDPLDPGALVIPSPVFPLAGYSVEDALRIMVAHERRHLLQAKRVTEMPGFPMAAAHGTGAA